MFTARNGCVKHMALCRYCGRRVWFSDAHDRCARFVEQRVELEHAAKRAADVKAAESKKASDRKAAVESGYEMFLTKHRDLVDKFLEIAERKVSVIDDYGDEDLDALPLEVHKCLAKIAKREPSVD